MVSHTNADKIIVSAFEILTAVAPFWVETGRTRIDASLIIPLGIASLGFMEVSVQSKNRFTAYVHLLQILCRNHLANTKCAIHYNVTSLLYHKFFMHTEPHFDTIWRQHLSALEQFLLPAAVAMLMPHMK